ncbi:hypothetical protein NDA18_003069 [Ustilago nuda]|nr:hypothetical protein NDA18_003069 [Ustilago nuda]
MRTTFFIVASLAVLSTLSFNIQETEARSLSNRHANHNLVGIVHASQRRGKVCKNHAVKRPSSGTYWRNPHKAGTSSSTKPASSAAKAASTASSEAASTSTRAVTATTPSSTSSSSRSSTTTASSSSGAMSGAPSLYAGAAPPNSPWDSCFDLTATAFQPNWKGEATTTWCGVEFDKTSPIIALPLAQLSKAYGFSGSVTYYSHEPLWRKMIADWCGREVVIQGPAGSFKAYFGDANEWTSVDVNMNLFTKLKGVPTGSYVDPNAAGWMNGVKGCFTGHNVALKNGYPLNYN